MSIAPGKPVVFISYSHKDEPDRAPEYEIHWLTAIQEHLRPAVRRANGSFDVWTDEAIPGGADWASDIKAKLTACDICILLVSRHSLDSDYCIDVEIETIRQRQSQGHKVQIYPIALSPFVREIVPEALLALNIRPRLDKPLSSFSYHRRNVEIAKIVSDIIGLLGRNGPPAPLSGPPPQVTDFVHITSLPETPYVNLVGRDAELERLDKAWADPGINIISLVAEGGAGKSALINEWLKRLRAENYRGAAMVLGWSFYSQGTKERATSADGFLDWAVAKLDITNPNGK